MKTMFTMGYGNFFSQPLEQRRPFMGDTTIDGNVLLKTISNAGDKGAAINQWMANRPQWQDIMGAYLPRWKALQDQVDQTIDSVTNVQQRISTNDPAAWQLKSWEVEDVNNYAAAINEQYSLINSHPQLKPGVPVPAAPGMKPTAVAASSGPSPIVIGVGAVAAVGLLALALK